MPVSDPFAWFSKVNLHNVYTHHSQHMLNINEQSTSTKKVNPDICCFNKKLLYLSDKSECQSFSSIWFARYQGMFIEKAHC